jgi:glycosyltransferase involved in cell wall biosynthesis
MSAENPPFSNTVSVIMPAYNERASIEKCVQRVLANPLVTELVIVDDGSKDGTIEIIQRLAKSDPRIRATFHSKNRGKGAALRSGFALAQSSAIIIQDADLEYDPAEYTTLLKPIFDGRADVVFGSRFLGGPHRVHLFWHYLGNRTLTMICNILANVNLTDMETCYKAFKRDVLQKISLKADDFGFEPEFTIKVARAGCVIYEAPISYSGRSYAEGKKITWRDAIRALWYMLRFRFFDVH